MAHGSHFILATVTGLSLCVSAAAQSPSSGMSLQRVSEALAEQNRWLGEDENAQNWRRYLHADALVEQLSRGAGADRQVLESVLERYSGENPGLSSARFVAVREALAAWLASLPRPLTELPGVARRAQDAFQQLSADQVAASRARLERDMQVLEAALSTTSPENAQAWKDYLKWNELQQELAKPEGPSPVALQGFAERYNANEEGLELPAFANLRHDLLDHAYTLYFAEGKQAKSQYAQRLEEIAKRLESFVQQRSTEDASVVGQYVGWLERGGQAPQLVTSIRRHFDEPNLLATVSQRLVAAGANSDEARAKLNQPQAVRDVILQTSIEGTAYPQLNIDVSLVPSDERAAFDVHLIGGATSQNVGYRGPVTVYTTGYTSIHAAKRVYFDALGMSTSAAGASCATSTNIYDIAANCRLIERLAWKQAGKSKGQAESIASGRAEARIARQLDREMGERLAQANESYAERFRNRLLRRDGFPRVFHTSTSADQLTLQLLHASPNQLAADSTPPVLNETHDLSVRVHESLIANFGETLLGGVTLSDERLIELLTELKAEIPEELQITPDKDPWSITFTNERPVSAVFDGDTVRMAIRGRRFTRGDREVRAVVEISATYRLERSGNGAKLTRQGDLVADYVNRENQSVFEITMKSFLRKKFESLFKPEIASDGLMLPEQLRSIGKLHLQQLTSQTGWLVLGWQVPPDSAALTGAAADTSAEAVAGNPVGGASTELAQTAVMEATTP
ncbi:MAG: hypothetical protein AB7F89_19375 [Pirellulaceae bacterium]